MSQCDRTGRRCAADNLGCDEPECTHGAQPVSGTGPQREARADAATATERNGRNDAAAPPAEPFGFVHPKTLAFSKEPPLFGGWVPVYAAPAASTAQTPVGLLRALNSRDLRQVLMDVSNGIDSPGMVQMARHALQMLDAALASRYRAMLAAAAPPPDRNDLLAVGRAQSQHDAGGSRSSPATMPLTTEERT